MHKVYYNEIDHKIAAWLRESISAKLLPDGDVDERSIKDVKPGDLKGYLQCHFFAGIGGWPYALGLAGWKDRPCWTGSCPCQSFSSAGKRKGTKDPRHLWPWWGALIDKCKPNIVFGEQVSSKGGREWFDIVSTDLERMGYAVGALDTCAAGVGAPHMRQRLYLFGVGNSYWRGQIQHKTKGTAWQPSENGIMVVANSTSEGLERSTGSGVQGKSGGLAICRVMGEEGQTFSMDRKGFWKNKEWLSFRDGKKRPVEPGTFPLVNGVPARILRLRGYGNAICIPQAVEFIETSLEVLYGSIKPQ